MTAIVLTSTLIGASSTKVHIESDMSNSLPGIVIVGLGAKSIDESKERIRSAIKNSKLQNPKKRITINLSPADIPKDGSQFDLGMALSILLLSEQIPKGSLDHTLVLGELGLDGSLKPVRGLLAHLYNAKELGYRCAIIPEVNREEASLIEGITVFCASSLRAIYMHLNELSALEPVRTAVIDRQAGSDSHDISEVSGQEAAKRALTITAAGGHNILLTGPPGGGKTMLAKTLPGLLPPLQRQQVIETTLIHSLKYGALSTPIASPPFRSPHHTASHVSLVGGGAKPVPGEVSLAHNGVLFMDEIPEFSRQTLESLRQPIEDNVVHITRASTSVKYPSNFILIATANPCPCGNFGNNRKQCSCLQSKIDSYQSKLSGPLLDRIDLFVDIEPTEHRNLLAKHTNQQLSSSQVRDVVIRARNRQFTRQQKLNANLTSTELRTHAGLTDHVKHYLDGASEKLQISSRAYMKVLRVALTISDLSDSELVSKDHIKEALQLRNAQSPNP